jgi:hypothetical protein
MVFSPGQSRTKILSLVVSVIRSAGVTRWRKAITRMAPSDVKQSFLTPSLKLMVYLMIVENFTWTKSGRFWLPFHSFCTSSAIHPIYGTRISRCFEGDGLKPRHRDLASCCVSFSFLLGAEDYRPTVFEGIVKSCSEFYRALSDGTTPSSFLKKKGDIIITKAPWA